MGKPLAVVTAETTAPKRTRERIVLIEREPSPDWFVQAKTKSGRRVWYLRLTITGLNPRLFGPFGSKHQCLLFLDDAIDVIHDFDDELKDACTKRMIRETCRHIWPPIVEYPVLTQQRFATTKGR